MGLTSIAKNFALKPFHGKVATKEANIKPMIDLFPRWNVTDADKCWCAAFVYYCLIEAGFGIPYSPDECETCSLAGCGGFLDFAKKDHRIKCFNFDEEAPLRGDIVIFDKLFNNRVHDHIGIVVASEEKYIICAEGNVGNSNTSAIVKRKMDNHVNCFIRIPDGYSYYENKLC